MKKLFLTYLLTIGFIVGGCSKNEEDQNISSLNNVEDDKPMEVVTKPNVEIKWDGPFGFQKGITIDDLKAAGIDFEISSDGSLFIKETPIKNDKFATYSLFFSNKSGLCRILAFGKDQVLDSFGSQLKSEVDYYKDILVQKYGKFTTNLSTHNHPSKYFSLFLFKKEEIYGYLWEPKTAFPQSIKSIYLLAQSNEYEKGYIALQYTFDNNIDCETEEKQKDASGL